MPSEQEMRDELSQITADGRLLKIHARAIARLTEPEQDPAWGSGYKILPMQVQQGIRPMLYDQCSLEADIIGRSYQYLIRKFAEGSGQSAGEFFTPPEVGRVMALIMDPEPGMSVYDPSCGSAGLLIACEHVLDDTMKLRSKTKYAPLKMHRQEYVATTWAMGPPSGGTAIPRTASRR